jgi:peptide deformylase
VEEVVSMPMLMSTSISFTFLFFSVVLSGVKKKTYGLQLPIGTTSSKGHGRRRDFLVSSIQGLVIAQSKEACSFVMDENPLLNFPYQENWVGTSLPILSMEQAALIDGRSDFKMGRWPDPILRVSASKIDESLIDNNREVLQKVANKLRRTARVNQAVGLAAQQCGIDGSLVFLDDLKVNTMYKKSIKFSENDNGIDSGGMFLFNPRIIARSPEVDMKVWTEECLVLPPSFTATVLRDSSIMVQYENLEGKTKNKFLSGELARALQHEMDHDRGILILDHVDLEELESSKMKEIEKKGHERRMSLAYSRYIDSPNESSQRLAKTMFIQPANAVEPNDKDGKSEILEEKPKITEDICDEECKARRKKIIEERRALMKQSKSNTQRSDVLDLSRQRAALYGTQYGGL